MIFKQTISELQDIYKRKYYNNFRLIARRFETYDKIGGFYNEEIDDTATLTGYLCTCVDPSTYDVNGREIAITLEKGGGQVWYDGISSEFTCLDFTNDDNGYMYYKVVDSTNSITYYSELMYIDLHFIDELIGVVLTAYVRITEDDGGGGTVTNDWPVLGASFDIDYPGFPTLGTDINGKLEFSFQTKKTEFGYCEETVDLDILAGTFDYDTGTNTGTASWDLISSNFVISDDTVFFSSEYEQNIIAKDFILDTIDLST